MSSFEIRGLARGDLDFAAESTALEGWVGETRDAFEAFLLHAPAGCFIAEHDGRPAGICVATPYGDAGFIGELIVWREARGRGIGPRLLDAAIGFLRASGAVSIYLDGVERAVPFYESAGFRPVCRSLRFQGIPPAGPPPSVVRPMTPDDLPRVRSLDRAAFGADRGFFLERRLALFPGFARVLDDGRGISGFVLGQPGRGAVVAGPLVAGPDAPDPLALLAGMTAGAAGLPIRLGVLETNTRAAAAFRSLPGLVENRPSRRMVLGLSHTPGGSPLCWAVGSPAKG